MHRRLFVIVSCVLVIVIAGQAAAQTQPIVTTDLLQLRSVSSIDVAQNGQRAVFAVRSIATIPPENPDDQDAEPSYKNQSHIFVVELSDPNATPRRLTYGERFDSSPRISPDGKRIAFVRDVPQRHQAQAASASNRPQREFEPTSQIWVIDADGGEARQLTQFKSGATNPVWSPDGRRLLVSSAIRLDDLEGTPPYPMERPKRTWKDASPREGVKPRPDGTREQIRAWLERNASQLNPSLITRLEYQDETQLRGTWRFTHLFQVDPDAPVQPIDQNAARRITSGFYDHTEPSFMPDGQSVVYVSKKPVDQHPDRVLTTALWRINIDGSSDRQILGQEGWSFNAPLPSRDGSVIALVGRRVDEPAFRQAQVGIASMRGETASDLVWLTEESNFAGSVNAIQWLHAQPAIVFTTAMRGAFPMMMVSPGVVQPSTLVAERDGLPVGVGALGTGGGAIVYAQTTVSKPCELRVRDGRGDRAVYDLNPWIAQKTIVIPTSGTVTRPDGTQVQYWLMEPTNRVAGAKYPLAVNMHGGPSAMWGPGEFTMWHEFQLLCSWGFGVMYCNPRGSGGYGYEFQKKNFQDWGEGPAGDVLACVDQACLSEWVDANRLVLAGGSYAGYLTAYIIAHDHRFKAAMAQRGVYDFATFYGEGNAWRLVAWAMGGSPHDPRFRQALDRNNAFNFVTRIRTPLLIKHGSNDLRTGVSQSEMMYRALKELGKPVEYVRYPDAGHDLSRTGDPLQRMDRLNRMIEFFERYVTNDRPAPLASGG